MDSHSPHACSTREYTPSQAQSISASPPSLGLGNRPDQEVLELCSWCWTLSGRKPLPSRLSHLERASHRPDKTASSTTTTSLTWRECYTQARQPVSFNSISNTVGQPRGSTRTYNGPQATRSQALCDHNSPLETQTRASQNW
jgi:hypothetical protein